MRILYIKAIFKTIRLIMIIAVITYFTGMIFYIFSDITSDIRKYSDNKDEYSYDFNDNFIEKFDFASKDTYNRAIIMVYFTFTSLSTVGFGDYHPRSDSERIIIAIVLLFGVAIFSFVLGNFTEIMLSYKKLNS